MKKLKLLFFVFCILITFIFTAVFAYNILEPRGYDFLLTNVTLNKLPFDHKKNIYGHDNVVLVMIDNKSIEKHRWPWKRDLYNKVYQYFDEYAQEKVLISDSIFTTLDEDNKEADKKYFDTVKRMDNLVEGVMFIPKPYNDIEFGKKYDKAFIEKFGLKNVKKETDMPYLYRSMLTSPAPFLDSVKNNGSITIVPGFFDGYLSLYLGDETHRTHEYLINYKGTIFPSLAMRAFLIANNYPQIVVKDKVIEFPELNYSINYIKTPFQSIVPIKYYKLKHTGYSHKHYSAVDIIDSYDNIKAGKKPIISPEEFKDKYVVYGGNVTVGNGLNDNKKSAISINHPGADIQASAVDNIVNNDFLKVMPMWVNILISLFGMLCVVYAIKSKEWTKAIAYCSLILLSILLIALICFYFGIIITVLTPIVMCLYAMMITYINRYLIEEKNKQKVTSAMSKYMSEDVVKDVIKNIDNLGLGGKKAVVTVLFSDIRGFTSMSEQMSAQDVSQFLNEYFSAMEPIVTKHNGIINKFIGDAVMAVFGEPIQDENHSKNAVLCGMEMLEKVEELDKKWLAEGKKAIKIGIGINTGEVFVGNIGSEKRMEYTVIGDTVNLASRLESYNKTYNTQILISSSTYENSKDIINVNKISNVEIRGKSELLDIYEVTEII